jgi:SAM-dependent methyltransferase
MSAASMMAKVVSTAVRRTLEKAGLRRSYNEAFFEALRKGSISSAGRVAPIMADLVRPRSVVDVGCGEGHWLAAFAKAGVEDVVVVDGDYVDRSRLAIPRERFIPHELNTVYRGDRRFDLAMSVECAEHIRPENSGKFADTLVGLAPVVMFSAALPYQGGRDHFNERWIDSWIRIFEQRGYVSVDALRAQVWDDRAVEWWYRQNLMVYVEKGALGRYAALVEAGRKHGFPRPVVVHPECYLQGVEWGWTRRPSYTRAYPGQD